MKIFSASYNLLAKSISTRKHMFERAIWEIAQVHFWKFWNCPSKKRAISKISKIYSIPKIAWTKHVIIG